MDRPREDRPRDDDRPQDDPYGTPMVPIFRVKEAPYWSLDGALLTPPQGPEGVTMDKGGFKWASAQSAPISVDGNPGWIAVVYLGACGATKETWVIARKPHVGVVAVGSQGVRWSWMREGALIPTLRLLTGKDQRKLFSKLGSSTPLVPVSSLPGFRSLVSPGEPQFHSWVSRGALAVPVEVPRWAVGAKAWRIIEGVYLVFPPDAQDHQTEGSIRLIPRDELDLAYNLEAPDYRQGDILIYTRYNNPPTTQDPAWESRVIWPDDPDLSKKARVHITREEYKKLTPEERQDRHHQYAVDLRENEKFSENRNCWDLEALTGKKFFLGDHRISWESHEWERLRVRRGSSWFELAGKCGDLKIEVAHPHHTQLEFSLQEGDQALFVRAPGMSNPFPKKGNGGSD